MKTQPAVVDPLPRASRKTLVYRTLRAAVSAWCRGVHRMRVEGARHLPLSGGVLLVANHQSALDVPMIAAATMMEPTTARPPPPQGSRPGRRRRHGLRRSLGSRPGGRDRSQASKDGFTAAFGTLPGWELANPEPAAR